MVAIGQFFWLNLHLKRFVVEKKKFSVKKVISEFFSCNERGKNFPSIFCNVSFSPRKTLKTTHLRRSQTVKIFSLK